MSISRIATGDGYEYYLRSVATHDVNDRGQQGLADYYSERGEAPGRWLGRGLAGVGKTAGEAVSEPQMRALFGRGMHPDAEQITAAVTAEHSAGGMGREAARSMGVAAARLGTPFSSKAGAEYEYRYECAQAMAAWNVERGRIDYAPIPEDERARIRTEVARRMFAEEHHRPPAGDRELSGWVARASRPAAKAVAGFDLTFSPVKSVSALWALGGPEVAAAVRAAHEAALGEAIDYLEQHATFTRAGRNGARQVDVDGLIVTAFDHRDTRAGDPGLHTHAVISNKVRRSDTGAWGALDGRMPYKHNVAASEVYNTRLEHHLTAALGVVFADREPTGEGKRTVREIAGIDERLLAVWSGRSAAVKAGIDELTRRFQADHGREPGPVEAIKLAQQATLATRPGKAAARSEAEQRTTWRREAAQVLGSEAAVETMIATALNPERPDWITVDEEWIAHSAAAVIGAVSATRATWQRSHVHGEAARLVRRSPIDPAHGAAVITRLTTAAMAEPFSIPRGDHDTTAPTPALARRDGTSVYTTSGSTLHTSPQILAAERRLIDQALHFDHRAIPVAAADAALTAHAGAHPDRVLNPGQEWMVRSFATSGARLQIGLSPAGTGKTAAMRVLADAWKTEGGTVIGLSPTAAAAARLGEEIGAEATTVDKFVDLHRSWTAELATNPDDRFDDEAERLPGRAYPSWFTRIDHRTLVIIDEVALSPTLALDTAVTALAERGASVRAVGDDQQLAAVAAGGAIRDVVAHAGAVDLYDVMRFADPGERAASLALREGDPAALAHYLDHSRVQVGTLGALVEAAFGAWAADDRAGRDTALLAPTRELVAQLNTRARTDRLQRTGGPRGREVVLGDGLRASAGDLITTRRNNTRLRISRTDYVRNGYRWQLRTVHPDGRITAAHLASGRTVVLPANYVAAHTQLGYAATIDSAQGMTVDTCHGVLTGREHRAQLYVMLTRGRAANHAYIATAGTGENDSVHTIDAVHPPTAVEALTAVLAREPDQTSATTADRRDRDPAHRLAAVVDGYLDLLGVAAEHHTGPDRLAEIDAAAEHLVPGLTGDTAYPVLRAHLATLEASGRDAVGALTAAVRARELGTAGDRAAVLDWRIDPTGRHSRAPGPLPWLPAIPAALATDPGHGPLLQQRADQITTMAAQLHERATAWTPRTAPAWAARLLADRELAGELAVWRAAQAVPDRDRRPTGPPRYPVAEHREQQRLDHRTAEHLGARDHDARRWTPLARELHPALTTDPYWPELAAQFSRAADAGLDLPAATRTALTETDRPLPVEQPAAALRWRMAAVLDDPVPAPEFVDALTRIRLHPIQQLTDHQLAEQIRHLRTVIRHDHQMNAILFPHHRRTETATEQVTRRHARLDRDAERIRTAQRAAQTAAAAALDLAATEAARDAAQARYDQTSRWNTRSSTRTELRDARDAAEAAVTEHQDTLRAAHAEAERLARDTGTPPFGWAAILDDADDTAARARELADAHRADARDDEVRDRQHRNLEHEETRLRTAVDEQHRRRALTDDERTTEHHARTTLREPDAPGTEPDTGPGFDPGPAPDPSRGAEHGYGL